MDSFIISLFALKTNTGSLNLKQRSLKRQDSWVAIQTGLPSFSQCSQLRIKTAAQDSLSGTIRQKMLCTKCVMSEVK